MTEPQEKFLQENLPPVEIIARAVHRRAIDLDELCSVGNLALGEAALSFEFHKGDGSEWAQFRILKEMNHAATAAIAHREDVPFEDGVVHRAARQETVPLAPRWLIEAFAELEPKERLLLDAEYHHNCSVRERAEMLGVSKDCVGVALASTRNKIRRAAVRAQKPDTASIYAYRKGK